MMCDGSWDRGWDKGVMRRFCYLAKFLLCDRLHRVKRLRKGVYCIKMCSLCKNVFLLYEMHKEGILFTLF